MTAASSFTFLGRTSTPLRSQETFCCPVGKLNIVHYFPFATFRVLHRSFRKQVHNDAGNGEDIIEKVLPAMSPLEESRCIEDSQEVT